MTPALAWEVAVPIPSLAPIDKRYWSAAPNMVDESLPRELIGSAALGGPTSGTLRCVGNLIIPAGVLVSNMYFLVQAAAVGLTNFWVCLIDEQTNTIVGVSAELFNVYGATGLPAGFSPALPFTPYRPSKDSSVYAGILQAGTTPNTLRGFTGLSGSINAPPNLVGDSTVFGAVGPPAVGTSVVDPTGAFTAEWWVGIN